MANRLNVPTFTESYSICCPGSDCGNTETAFGNKPAAIAWLMNHIEDAHPGLLKQLDIAAREAARLQNGLEWNWRSALKMVKDSWRREVVLSVLGAVQEGSNAHQR